jgi:hypothetical protein
MLPLELADLICNKLRIKKLIEILGLNDDPIFPISILYNLNIKRIENFRKKEVFYLVSINDLQGIKKLKIAREKKNHRNETIKYYQNRKGEIEMNNVMIIACRYGHLKIVQYLLENGANIRAYHDGAIIAASKEGQLEVVKYLVEKGANALDGRAIDFAKIHGHENIVEYLESKRKNN